MMPVRVGFTPTFLISRSEPGTMDAATMKNAADEMSDGMSSGPLARSADAPAASRRSLFPDLDAEEPEHALRMVPGL